jgi:hypothetical protein
MPNWILKLAASWGFSWAISYLAGRIRKDKAALAALKMHRAGGTFLEIARVYASVTPEVTDDQIVESLEQLKRDLAVKPFNQLIKDNQILALFGATKIPDFDDDPSNDQALADLLGKIVDESMAEE